MEPAVCEIGCQYTVMVVAQGSRLRVIEAPRAPETLPTRWFRKETPSED